MLPHVDLSSYQPQALVWCESAALLPADLALAHADGLCVQLSPCHTPSQESSCDASILYNLSKQTQAHQAENQILSYTTATQLLQPILSSLLPLSTGPSLSSPSASPRLLSRHVPLRPQCRRRDLVGLPLSASPLPRGRRHQTFPAI